jgi:hypothetical protein
MKTYTLISTLTAVLALSVSGCKALGTSPNASSSLKAETYSVLENGEPTLADPASHLRSVLEPTPALQPTLAQHSILESASGKYSVLEPTPALQPTLAQFSVLEQTPAQYSVLEQRSVDSFSPQTIFCNHFGLNGECIQ